jgi:hypothetical protein
MVNGIEGKSFLPYAQGLINFSPGGAIFLECTARKRVIGHMMAPVKPNGHVVLQHAWHNIQYIRMAGIQMDNDTRPTNRWGEHADGAVLHVFDPERMHAQPIGLGLEQCLFPKARIDPGQFERDPANERKKRVPRFNGGKGSIF